MSDLEELEQFCEQLAADAERKVEWTLSGHIDHNEAILVRNEVFKVCNLIEDKIALAKGLKK